MCDVLPRSTITWTLSFSNMGIKTKGIKSTQPNYCTNEHRGFSGPYYWMGYVLCPRFILRFVGKSTSIGSCLGSNWCGYSTRFMEIMSEALKLGLTTFMKEVSR